MRPVSPDLLQWSPAAAEDTVNVFSPCGTEGFRGVVFPTTPKLPAWNARNTVEVAEVRELLHEQTNILMGRMELMMVRHEDVLVKLLQEHSRSESAMRSYVQAKNADEAYEEAIYEKELEKELEKQFNSVAMGHSSRSILQKEDKNNFLVSISLMGFLRKLKKPEEEQSGSQGFFQSLRTMSATGHIADCNSAMKSLLRNQMFELAMTIAILFNTVLIVIETDRNAACEGGTGCAPSWVFALNLVLLGVYTLESLVVIYVHRCHVFRHPSRLFEIFIVVLGYLDIIILEVFGDTFPSMQSLRLVRLTRLLRGMRLFNFFPELRSMIIGFFHAMRVMFWGFLLLMILLIVVAIAAVELIHPISQDVPHDSQYCSEAFESVWHATLWFFQTAVAGDSWGACALPIIKFRPVTFVFVGGILVALQVGFLNLVMSVIIDQVQDARSKDTESKVRQKEKDIEASRRKWFKLFDQLDKDSNGELSIDEVQAGFDTIPDFSDDLKLLGIERDDLPKLMKLMDEDDNNQVSVDELVSMFDMVVHFDNKMHQVTMGMQLRVIGQRLEMRLRKLQHQVNALTLRDKPSMDTLLCPIPVKTNTCDASG